MPPKSSTQILAQLRKLMTDKTKRLVQAWHYLIFLALSWRTEKTTWWMKLFIQPGPGKFVEVCAPTWGLTIPWLSLCCSLSAYSSCSLILWASMLLYYLSSYFFSYQLADACGYCLITCQRCWRAVISCCTLLSLILHMYCSSASSKGH